MENYHTHTYRCKHANGDVRDFAQMAMLKNISVLGISDHNPTPDNWWGTVRMEPEELSDYMQAIEEARLEFPKLRILKGLECDYFDRYCSYYTEIKEQYQMDYMIGSVHNFLHKGELIDCFETKPYDKGMLASYAELYVKAMESGLFTFMAHPDLFCHRLGKWNEEAAAVSVYILQAAKDLKMPLEINCRGIKKSLELGRFDILYPKKEFWELAGQFDIQACVSSDAHDPKDLTANLDAGYFVQKEYRIRNFVL